MTRLGPREYPKDGEDLDQWFAVEITAQGLARSANGGEWETHYTEKQRNLWRKRAAARLQKFVETSQ